MSDLAVKIKCDDPTCSVCVDLCRDGRELGQNGCQQCGSVCCDLMMIQRSVGGRLLKIPSCSCVPAASIGDSFTFEVTVLLPMTWPTAR